MFVINKYITKITDNSISVEGGRVKRHKDSEFDLFFNEEEITIVKYELVPETAKSSGLHLYPRQ